MSDVGNALSGGGSDASGVSDSTFSDATLGDQIMGGTGNFTGSDISPSDAGGGGFQNFSNLATALSGGSGGVGASPAAAQAASMAPAPSAAAASGGDPVGAASGTQSSTTPGSTSPADQNQQQQSGQNKNQQDQNQYAPKSATDQLRTLLKALSGKPTGPSGPTVPAAPAAPFALPTLARGQTGAQSPQMPLPGVSPGETGDQSPQAPATQAPGIADQLLGAQPAGARLPPVPSAKAAIGASPQNDMLGGTPRGVGEGGGRDITVQKAAPQAMPFPQNEPGEVAPGGPALPTHKPTQPPQADEPSTTVEEPRQAAPQPTPPPPRLLQDITGASTGAPIPLAELAQVAMALLPLIGMFGGRRGGRGGFQGMRGFRPFGAPGGFHPGGRFGHPAWRGAWPYHHPMHGWDMHHQHPGGGWLPLNPAELQGLGGGQQGGQPGAQDPNAPDPNRPPKETGGDALPPDKTPTTGAIPGVSAKDVDAYTRQAASKWGIDPDVASRVLAQESSYGQAKEPGDNGTSFGPFQLHFAPDGKAMGDQFQRDTGLNPRDPSTWKAQIDYAMKKAADPSGKGWLPWQTTMKKLGMNQWSGITTRDKFAGQPRTNIQPAWAAAAPTPTLPITSQPMVAGP